MSTNAIIPCGGVGARTGLDYNKIFYKIDGEEVIMKTLRPFLALDEISRVIVVYNKDDKARLESLTRDMDKVVLVEGGNTRSESVMNGLGALEEDADIVAIHDGARPFIKESLILDSIESARTHGGATLYVPITDTIKRIDKDMHIVDTPNRNEYISIQTPQTFKADKLKYAYEHTNVSLTDDTQVYEQFFGPVALVLGDKNNIKITTADDLARTTRVGIGFDTHKLAEGRKLILGGIDVPHTKGLLGHSDADVVTHAIMDAVLSAAGLRDIGVLFPDTDNSFKDIYSIRLLEKVYELVSAKGYRIGNISAVIMAQKPKLKDYIPLMVTKLAETLHTDRSNINLSATTTEGIGLVGREEGISTHAICSLIATEVNIDR